ncbi:MAG: hypothetical protein M0C28_21830 [Candidatus Moduliflexus flocculans]|nr:hypothetical protein [Candidatus Moduliflexus flocculans]
MAAQILGQGRCVFILLKGEVFPFEEAAKAAHLGVNGVVKEDLGDRAELSRFQQILETVCRHRGIPNLGPPRPGRLG